MDNLYQISKITDNLYLSGAYPLATDDIVKYGITHIVCCVSENYISSEHANILQLVPTACILYLPYDDIVTENLWKINEGGVSILTFNKDQKERSRLANLLNLYIGKSYIEIGYNFIDAVVKSDHRVLVHCMAGVSRSVSVLSYYIMKKINIGFDECIKFIRTHRSIAGPNKSFVEQLKLYGEYRDKYRYSHSKSICDSYLMSGK